MFKSVKRGQAEVQKDRVLTGVRTQDLDRKRNSMKIKSCCEGRVIPLDHKDDKEMPVYIKITSYLERG